MYLRCYPPQYILTTLDSVNYLCTDKIIKARLDVEDSLSKGIGPLSYPGPEITSDAIEHALTSTRPAIRYLVGYDAYLVKVVSFLPSSVADMILGAQQRVLELVSN